MSCTSSWKWVLPLWSLPLWSPPLWSRFLQPETINSSPQKWEACCCDSALTASPSLLQKQAHLPVHVVVVTAEEDWGEGLFSVRHWDWRYLVAILGVKKLDSVDSIGNLVSQNQEEHTDLCLYMSI